MESERGKKGRRPGVSPSPILAPITDQKQRGAGLKNEMKGSPICGIWSAPAVLLDSRVAPGRQDPHMHQPAPCKVPTACQAASARAGTGSYGRQPSSLPGTGLP